VFYTKSLGTNLVVIGRWINGYLEFRYCEAVDIIIMYFMSDFQKIITFDISLHYDFFRQEQPITQ